MDPEDPYDDAEALAQVAEMGVDLSRPMEIDFFVAVPDQEVGERLAGAAEEAGFRAEVFQDDESEAWDCVCSVTMVPTIQSLGDARRKLDGLCASFGGFCDGWATTGEPGEE